MAHQSGLLRGQSWSTGSSAGSLSSPATRWMKSERLQQLELEARTTSSEMKVLEAEIHDLAARYEKLKKVDSKPGERLQELVDDEAEDDVEKEKEKVDGQGGEGLNGEEPEDETKADRSSDRQESEKVQSLKSEHAEAQTQIEQIKATLEEKRLEFDALSAKHQTTTEVIAKEEKLAQAAEIGESLQHSAAVQQEMRSPSEDLGRLGRLMEGLKDTSNSPESPQRPLLKGRVYHPVTQLRSRNLYRTSTSPQNGSGSSPDLGRSLSLGDPPMPSRSKEPNRSKEPAEFEEREGSGNRKRQKNSSFELERERLHAERAKLEVEAKEKRRLRESLASFSSQLPAQGSSTSSRDSISSPLSVFEGFGQSPSLGSIGPPSSESRVSDSSESSSEFSLERPDSGSFSSAVKRLDFESFATEDSIAPFSVDEPNKGPSGGEFEGNGIDHDAEIMREMYGKQPQIEEGEFKEQLPSENGKEEFHLSAANSFSDTAGLEDFLPLGGAEEMQEGLGVQGSSPRSAAEENQGSSEVEMVELQGPEDLSPESGTESKRISYMDMLRRESVESVESVPEEIQEPTPDEILVETFEREVIELLQAECSNAGRETDSETQERVTLPGGVQEDEVEEIDIPQDEFDSFRDVEEEEEEGGEAAEVEDEIMTARSRVEEIDVPEEDIEDFEDGEPADEASELQILNAGRRVHEDESSVGSKREVSSVSDDDDDASGEDATGVWEDSAVLAHDPQQNGFKSAESHVSESRRPPDTGEWRAEETGGERPNRRVVAENQMMQLTSQLSLLQKQVEEEVELHEKDKSGAHLERSSAEKEQLGRQVSFFADEVLGLRQNIEEIQRILPNEGGDFSSVEHWARDLNSKCADQSAQLEHLGKQVRKLGKYLEHHLQLRLDLDDRLDKEAQERQKVEAQFTNLNKALYISVSSMEKEEEAVGELIEHQKHLLVDQLKEAEKLRHLAEVRVSTLNNQIDQLEMICEAAKSVQAVTKYQDKTCKQGLQTLLQLFLLAVGIVTLYSRVAEPFRASLVPT